MIWYTLGSRNPTGSCQNVYFIFTRPSLLLLCLAQNDQLRRNSNYFEQVISLSSAPSSLSLTFFSLNRGFTVGLLLLKSGNFAHKSFKQLKLNPNYELKFQQSMINFSNVQTMHRSDKFHWKPRNISFESIRLRQHRSLQSGFLLIVRKN